MLDEIRWIVGLNIVLAVWLGMLADSWKGRRMGVWMLIGLLTSVFGLLLLVCMPKLPANRQQRNDAGKNDRHSMMAPTDSYGH